MAGLQQIDRVAAGDHQSVSANDWVDVQECYGGVGFGDSPRSRVPTDDPAEDAVVLRNVG